MDKMQRELITAIKLRKDGKILASLLGECEIDCTGNITLIKAPCREYCEAIFKLPYALCIDWAYGKLYGAKCKVSLVCMLTSSNGIERGML